MSCFIFGIGADSGFILGYPSLFDDFVYVVPSIRIGGLEMSLLDIQD